MMDFELLCRRRGTTLALPLDAGGEGSLSHESSSERNAGTEEAGSTPNPGLSAPPTPATAAAAAAAAAIALHEDGAYVDSPSTCALPHVLSPAARWSRISVAPAVAEVKMLGARLGAIRRWAARNPKPETAPFVALALELGQTHLDSVTFLAAAEAGTVALAGVSVAQGAGAASS